MVIPRDPADERLRERTTASFIFSLFIHALVALLFFSVLTSSSEQSSPESVEGNPSLTIAHVSVRKTVKSAPPVVHPPLTNAKKTGPPKARPVMAGHPPVPARRELAKQNPKAPPNPTPAPIAPFSPNPQPSQVAMAMPTQAPVPEVPQSVPHAAPVIAKPLAATPQPTAAPATPAPSPKPTIAPQEPVTAKPAPASPAPTAAPTKAPPTAAPRAAVSAIPAPKPTAAGNPSPAPTGVPSPTNQRGNAPTPGPKPLAPAGQVPVKAKSAPARAIQVPPPTPSPAPPKRTRTPKPAKTASPKQQSQLNDLRNRILAGLPNGPVNPTQGHYNGTASIGKPGDPTPPPEILARTKYIYESGGIAKAFNIFGGSEQRIKMYVTDIKRHGAFTTCTGWIVRYPQGSGSSFGTLNSQGRLDTGFPGRGGANTYEPVIETNVTFECESSRLKPYAAAPAPSPAH